MVHSSRGVAIAALLIFAIGCSKSGGGGGGDAGNGSLVAPSGLTAAASTSTLSITLTWDSESAAAGGYQIYRTDVGQLDMSAANRYVDTNLAAGTSYSYTVRAVDADGNVSGDSNAATALTIPDAPGDLAASNITSTSITITWTEADGAEGGDEVTYVTGHIQPITIGATGTSYTATNLTPDTAYTFSVIARDATGPGPAAMAIFTTLNGTGPGDGGSPDGGNGGDGGNPDDGGTPGDGGTLADGGSLDDAFNLSAAGSDTVIILQWDDQGEPSYQIFRAHGSGDYGLIGTTASTNFADLGGSSHPIVTNDSYSYYIVPLDGSGLAQPTSSAATATAFGVAVHEADQYLDDVSTNSVAASFSSGVTALGLGETLQLIPGYPDGGADFSLDDAITPVGSDNGYAVFSGVPAAGYLLYSGTPRIYGSAPAGSRALDLSTAVAGRITPDTGDTTLVLHLSALDSWDVNNDSLQAFAWGSGSSSYNGASIDSLLDTALVDGGTAANDSTLDSEQLFSSGGLVESSKGDVFYVLQTELDSSGNSPYTAARKSYAASSQTWVDGSSSNLTGAMVGTPSISETLTVTRNPQAGSRAFLTYISAVNPDAVAGNPASAPVDYGAVTIGAEPGYASAGSYGLYNFPPQLWFGNSDGTQPFAPQLFTGSFPSGNNNVMFGTAGSINFVNPFPAHWDLFLTAYVPYTVQMTVAGLGLTPITGRLQTQGLLSSYIASGNLTIGPGVSPVQSPMINGHAANATGNAQLSFDATAPLIFSWSSPALGTPTLYTITLWELPATGAVFTGAPAATLQTTALNATLPSGVLDSGTPYVAFITATQSNLNRFSTGVLAYDENASSADCISSSFVVQ